MFRFRRALLASVICALVAAPQGVAATPAPHYVAVWNDAGAPRLTLAELPDLAARLNRPVAGVFVASDAIKHRPLAERSLLAELNRAGLWTTGLPATTAAMLGRIPERTPLRLAAGLVAGAVGVPGGSATTRDTPGSDDACTGAKACMKLLIAIELVGMGPECPGPKLFGICLPPGPITPAFEYATTHSASVSRIDGAIDTLTPSSIHFRSNDGDNWGNTFTVHQINPNQAGAGASYAAAATGRWRMLEDDVVSFPPGIAIDRSTTLTSGFCIRWGVRYPGYSAAQLSGFQLNWEITAGFGTGGYSVDQVGYCTLS